MKEQKRILFLGGIAYIIPAILKARELGYYVITADYLPDNPAHVYADEYVNISIINKEEVLKVAIEKHVNAILSYAVDPGVETAAYVCEKLGLPTVGPYESVKILQNKSLFRQFLRDNNFNVPKSVSLGKNDFNNNFQLKDFDFPVIVKPVDASGSKGVTKVENESKLKTAIEYALSMSISGNIIIEEFIELSGCQSGSDSFLLDGNLIFSSFDDQLFDSKSVNPYTPAIHIWPSSMSFKNQKYLSKELQRLLNLLKMKTSLYNIEVRVGNDGKPYIMEVSPRAGGNRISELLSLATGVDIVKASIQAAMGEDVNYITNCVYNGFWVDYIIHSTKSGIFKNIIIDPSIKNNIVKKYISVLEGDFVECFNCASNSLGTIFLKFEDRKSLNKFLEKKDILIKLEIE